MIRMRDESRGAHCLPERGLRAILATLILVAHDGHLDLTVFLTQPEIAHAIRLDGDVAFEALRAQRAEVGGPVHRGRGVVARADALEELIDARALRPVV